MHQMPALFIGHGSPMNIILENDFTAALSDLREHLPRPEAIMVVSAHWLTRGTYLTYDKHPRTIHDFYGFPDALYALDYRCPGAPDMAQQVRESVAGIDVRLSLDWGLDHAAWLILKHLYPEADIPVFEMSLDILGTPEYHYALGKKLISLRDRGLLIIGSGNIVHNLRLADFENMNAAPYDWAQKFDETVQKCLIEHDHQLLIDYNHIVNHSMAVPTNDHYLPMLYTLALQDDDEKIAFIYEGMQNASVSMRSIIIR